MTKQQEKVYRYILANPGCTTKDIMLETGIQCPSGRISELRRDGIDIQEVGTVKYPGSKAFVKYAIGKPLTKTVYTPRFNPDGTVTMLPSEVEV